MTALVDFLSNNLNEGADARGWLREDIPLGQWEGVTTNAEQQVVAVDLRALDPNLNRCHRLPHLQTLNLHGLDIKVNARYLDIIGRDYKYHHDFSVNLYGCVELTDDVLEGLTHLHGLVAIDLTRVTVETTWGWW